MRPNTWGRGLGGPGTRGGGGALVGGGVCGGAACQFAEAAHWGEWLEGGVEGRGPSSHRDDLPVESEGSCRREGFDGATSTAVCGTQGRLCIGGGQRSSRARVLGQPARAGGAVLAIAGLNSTVTRPSVRAAGPPTHKGRLGQHCGDVAAPCVRERPGGTAAWGSGAGCYIEMERPVTCKIASVGSYRRPRRGWGHSPLRPRSPLCLKRTSREGQPPAPSPVPDPKHRYISCRPMQACM